MKTPESEIAKLPMEEEPNSGQGNSEVDANIQKQAPQPISLDPRFKQPLAKQQNCPQSSDIWHTTPLPGAVISQMPTFLNYNNNASRGVSLAPVTGMECSHHQRPSVGLIQQVVECFKQSTKKEMKPSEVYTEMEIVFPYYKHIVGQKRKSWMSSVRHALTTPRFKSRKISEEEKATPTKRGCLWSLNEDYDENAPTPTPRRRRTPNPFKANTRRKQRFNTRNDYTPQIYHINRNNPTFFQPQQHVAQRYPFIEIPDSAPMQATFSPGPTGPIHAGGGNMYYQPYRAPTVGYVIAGQKMALPQQAMQPVNMGQWNVSGFSACNQQQYFPNNAAFFGGNNAMIHSNQNNLSGINQGFGHAVMPTILQTNQNNNTAVMQGQQTYRNNNTTDIQEQQTYRDNSTAAIQEQQTYRDNSTADIQEQHGNGCETSTQPTPVSIQTAEQTPTIEVQDITMCDVIQANDDMTEENQDFPNNQSESQVHDEIKKELRSLVYESLDICNSEDGQRSNQDCEVDAASTQTIQEVSSQVLQVNRSPTWAKSRPPHHAQGGFHNYAWSPLSHQTQNYQGPVAVPSQTKEQPQDQDQEQDGGETTEVIEATIIEDMDGQIVVQASISNESLDQTNDENTG